MKFTENDFAELAEILIISDGELLRTDSYNWEKLKQHPSFKQLLENYEKAKKWDFVKDKTGSKLFYGYIDGQKLRELIEKRQEKWKKASRMSEEQMYAFDEIQKLLEDSKK